MNKATEDGNCQSMLNNILARVNNSTEQLSAINNDLEERLNKVLGADCHEDEKQIEENPALTSDRLLQALRKLDFQVSRHDMLSKRTCQIF